MIADLSVTRLTEHVRQATTGHRLGGLADHPERIMRVPANKDAGQEKATLARDGA